MRSAIIVASSPFIMLGFLAAFAVDAFYVGWNIWTETCNIAFKKKGG